MEVDLFYLRIIALRKPAGVSSPVASAFALISYEVSWGTSVLF